jgi:predicted DsbA family dithiol-disulfide isomerase
MAAAPTVEVVEFTDPACSWAWGSEPKFRLLRWGYGDRLAWRRVMGGLVPNRLHRDPSFDPVAPAAERAIYWSKVTEHTGMPWPVHLERVPVSSIEGCVAVKAAERQGEPQAARLLRRMREACFVFGSPADSPERILSVAGGIDGLDIDRLVADMTSPEAEVAFRQDWEETRTPNEYVRTLREEHAGAGNAKQQEGRWRYVFPTLLFRGPGGEHTVPGWQAWDAYLAAMDAAVPGSTAEARPGPTVEQAFTEWGLLTGRELALLCGDDAVPPDGVVAYDWGAGLAWLTPAEAAARGLPAAAR